MQYNEDLPGGFIKRVNYTIGLDQISQTTTSGNTYTWHFGYDGHGSVRSLQTPAGAFANYLNTPQNFLFDAYGNLLNRTAANTGTTNLYSGETFDFRIGQQYLRARWYDPTTGRFNRLDPFAGNRQDPQSFRKYAFVHGNPIMGIDPSGEMLSSMLAISFRTGLFTGSLSAATAAIYGVSKGIAYGFNGEWSPFNILMKTFGAFGIGFGVVFVGAFSWSYLVMAAGASPALATYAIGMSFGPAGLRACGQKASCLKVIMAQASVTKE